MPENQPLLNVADLGTASSTQIADPAMATLMATMMSKMEAMRLRLEGNEGNFCEVYIGRNAYKDVAVDKPCTRHAAKEEQAENAGGGK